MYAPKAPRDFIRRYGAIIKGKEVIDSVAKLKDFWLFAIEQGFKHPDEIEAISYYTAQVNLRNMPYHNKPRQFPMKLHEEPLLESILSSFSVYEYIGAPDDLSETDEGFALRLWRDLEKRIISVNPADYLDTYQE